MEIEQNKQKAVKEPRWICAVAALPYTDLVASGSSDGFLRLWRVSQDWKKLDQVQQIQMVNFLYFIVETEMNFAKNFPIH
jgi:WD40 repeat protein